MQPLPRRPGHQSNARPSVRQPTPALSVFLGSVSGATKGFVGNTLLDTEEKIRNGAQVKYTGCCM